ncbi:response regulator transcription factor [Clostridium sp. JNZ J1-5]
MKNIIILDNKAYIRTRVKEIVAEYDINVYEAINSLQFFNILAEVNYNVELIIVEINLGSESGIEIIKRLKGKGVDIPILILTTENRRKEFAKGIRAGAIDYILKPFDEKLLLKRIVGDMEKGKNKGDNKKLESKEKEAQVELEEFLSEELDKDKELSIIMITFFKLVEKFTSELTKEYNTLSNIIYLQLKETLKESNLLIKYGPQSFIGTIKDINEDNKKLICEKVNETFLSLKQKSKVLEEYYLECVFVKYPEDGNNKEELITKARYETIERINKIKRMEK